MRPVEIEPPLTLFGSVDDHAADLLGIASIKHWSAIQRLSRNPPNEFDGSHFVRALFGNVTGNWRRCLDGLNRLPSRENWRWFDPKGQIAAHNLSAEVTLERAVVAAALSQGREDWSNQVPVASGLIAGGGDRRRAIDLVRRRGPAAFDFVELKVASDNPLYAAVEILKYGFVWLLSREHRERLGYAERVLIQASDVRLSVLAPPSYYDGLHLEWLADGIADGLHRLTDDEQEINLTFQFEAFPRGFIWPGSEPSAALSALDNRVRI